MTLLTSHLSRLVESKQKNAFCGESTEKKKQESKEKNDLEDDISQLSKVSLTHKYDDMQKILI